jgi:hypothetical protein
LNEDDAHHDSRGRLADSSWTGRDWDSFNNEEQPHIVDDWYRASLIRDGANFEFDANGIPVTNFDGEQALNDPAYRFIRDYIRRRNNAHVPGTICCLSPCRISHPAVMMFFKTSSNWNCCDYCLKELCFSSSIAEIFYVDSTPGMACYFAP